MIEVHLDNLIEELARNAVLVTAKSEEALRNASSLASCVLGRYRKTGKINPTMSIELLASLGLGPYFILRPGNKTSFAPISFELPPNLGHDGEMRDIEFMDQ